MSADERNRIQEIRRAYFKKLRCNEYPAFPSSKENVDERSISASVVTTEVRENVAPSEKSLTGSLVDPKAAEKIQMLVKKQHDIANKEVESEMKTQSLLLEEMSILTETLMESTMDVILENFNLSYLFILLYPIFILHGNNRYRKKSIYRIWS
jgi:hypothetical protein